MIGLLKKYGKKTNQEAEQKNLPAILRSTVPMLDMRPLPYAKPEEFDAFDRDFESHVKAYLEKARPDGFNGTFMDAEILYILRQALERLDEQLLSHKDVICNSIERQLGGEKRRMESRLQDLLREQKETERRLQVYEHALYHGTSLEALCKRE